MKQKPLVARFSVDELLNCPLRSKCKCKNVLCFKIEWNVTMQNFLQNLSSNGDMIGTGFTRINAINIRGSLEKTRYNFFSFHSLSSSRQLS